jgi:hypothetical protein
MKRLLRTPLAAIMLAACVVQLQAQKVGTTSLQFLKVMPTARATAMGDAFVSLANGADATFWNPAGLSSVENMEFTSTFTTWLFDTRQIAIASAFSMGDWGTVGLQFQFVDYGAMDESRPDMVDLVISANGDRFFSPGLNGRTFTPYAYLLGASYAKAFTQKFSAGVTVKYITESLWSDPVIRIVNPTTNAVEDFKTYANVMLFDLGMKYNTGFRSVCLGVSVQNFGPQVTFASVSYPAPLAFRIGISADLLGSNALLLQSEMNRLTVAYGLFQPNDYDQQMHVGAEYSFDNVVALRVGYKVDYDTEGLTYGAGLQTIVSGTPIFLDYSFGQMNALLNNVHRIGLGVRFR